MLQVIELAFGCFAVVDIRHARKSHESVPGLEPTSVFDLGPGRWVENEFGAHALVISSAPAFKPSQECGEASLKVADFGAAIDHLKEQRVKSRMAQEGTPARRRATMADPDGKTICIRKGSYGR